MALGSVAAGVYAWLAQSVEPAAVNRVVVSSSLTPGANMGRYTVSGSGADCKSAALGSGGSTPSLPTNDIVYLHYDRAYLPGHDDMLPYFKDVHRFML